MSHKIIRFGLGSSINILLFYVFCIYGVKNLDPIAAQTSSYANTAASGDISTVEMQYQLTGNHQEAREKSPWPALINNTSIFQVYGTDLGIPFYSPYYNFVFFLYGDTFGQDDLSEDERPRTASNFLAGTFDFDATDGISILGVATDSNLKANQLIDILPGNASAIPTSALSSVSGPRQYIWVMDVEDWDPDPVPSGGRLVYTDDLYNTYNANPGVAFSENSFFVMSTMLRVGNFVYIYGTKAMRSDGVKIARVHFNNIEDKSDYEYFIGDTTWEGSSDESDAIEVINQQVGELSVMWNPYLGKYMMLFFSNEGSPRIRMRLANNPWGPWEGQREVLLCFDSFHPEYQNCYGSYMLPQYIDESGKQVFFIMSRMTGGAKYNDCYLGASEPCNKAYNTFQMRIVFN